MPIIKSAIKKLRQDKKRTKHNLKIRENIKKLLKIARKTPSPKRLQEVSSALDKAVKTKLIHKNKASRLKSRLSKRLPTTPLPKITKPAPKKKS